MMNCQTCQSELPELLLSSVDTPLADHAEGVRAHLDTCSDCQKEFASLQSTFALLDTWHAPEPSAYFDQKLAVLLREEAAKPPANWLERMKARFLFNTGRQFRPALAGVTALALLLGGGTFAGISVLPVHHGTLQISAAVSDLQILDNNDQALQQMDQLQDDQTADSPAASPSSI